MRNRCESDTKAIRKRYEIDAKAMTKAMRERERERFESDAKAMLKIRRFGEDVARAKERRRNISRWELSCGCCTENLVRTSER